MFNTYGNKTQSNHYAKYETVRGSNKECKYVSD